MDGVTPEVAGNPATAELLRHARRGAGAAEEVGDQVALVAAGLDDAFEEGFRLLGIISQEFRRLIELEYRLFLPAAGSCTSTSLNPTETLSSGENLKY